MSEPPRTPDSSTEPAETPTRAEVLIEAMIADRERRKPGYARRLMQLLLTPPDETVTVLRPTTAPDDKVKASAIAWLREASVRVRAHAATKRRNP